ncbi:MAG TPA: GNAT family protein [Candidatus Limnocylindria bacterium]|nr:GNAT family protein [Candidatus Limnocylindria bacterium]
MTDSAVPPDRPPIPERPMIQGQRVWLRPLEERDMPAYAAGINDTEVGIPAGYRWPMSVDLARAWLERQQDSVKRGDAFLFAVCELGDDRFIGTTWLKEVSWMDGSAELAIYMDHDHIGAGWGTDAVRTLLRFGFVSLGLRRIWLTVDADNARAIRSYEKVGFQREGVMRQARRGLNGLADSVMMAILRDEWEPPAT